MASRGLTARQRRFVSEYLKCGENGTLAASKAGYTGNPSVLAVQASRLLATDKIAEALAEERKALASTDTYDRSEWLKDTLLLREEARKNKAWSASAKLHELLGKALGVCSPNADKSHSLIEKLSAVAVNVTVNTQESKPEPEPVIIDVEPAGHRVCSIEAYNDD